MAMVIFLALVAGVAATSEKAPIRRAPVSRARENVPFTVLSNVDRDSRSLLSKRTQPSDCEAATEGPKAAKVFKKVFKKGSSCTATQTTCVTANTLSCGGFKLVCKRWNTCTKMQNDMCAGPSVGDDANRNVCLLSPAPAPAWWSSIVNTSASLAQQSSRPGGASDKSDQLSEVENLGVSSSSGPVAGGGYPQLNGKHGLTETSQSVLTHSRQGCIDPAATDIADLSCDCMKPWLNECGTENMTCIATYLCCNLNASLCSGTWKTDTCGSTMSCSSSLLARNEVGNTSGSQLDGLKSRISQRLTTTRDMDQAMDESLVGKEC